MPAAANITANITNVSGATLPSGAEVGAAGIIVALVLIIGLPILMFVFGFIWNALFALFYNYIVTRVAKIQLDFGQITGSLHELKHIPVLPTALAIALVFTLLGLISGILSGNYGEFILYRKIVGIFGKDYVFTNVYLDNKNTDHTEVDVIALSNHGIYVFEMKNYSGYIYGSEKDQYWTQVLNKYSKHKFYNPLRQNYAHIKAIEKYLELNENEIIPVVVFSNNSKLSKINVKKENHIIQIKDLNRLINSNAKSDFIDIPVIRRKEISVKLIERSNMPQEIKNKHIEQVTNLQEKTLLE